MENFSCEVSPDGQVIENLYLKMYVERNAKSSRFFCGLICLAFLVFSGFLFYFSGYSFFLSTLFIIPCAMFFCFAPWLSWRLSCIGYKTFFSNILKSVKFDDCHFLLTKSRGGDVESEKVNFRTIYRVVESDNYLVVFYGESVEIFMKSVENEQSIKSLVSKIRLAREDVDYYMDSKGIHYFGTGVW